MSVWFLKQYLQQCGCYCYSFPQHSWMSPFFAEKQHDIVPLRHFTALPVRRDAAVLITGFLSDISLMQ